MLLAVATLYLVSKCVCLMGRYMYVGTSFVMYTIVYQYLITMRSALPMQVVASPGEGGQIPVIMSTVMHCNSYSYTPLYIPVIGWRE